MDVLQLGLFQESLSFNSGWFFAAFSLFLLGLLTLSGRPTARTVYVLLFSYGYYFACNGGFALALVGTTVLDHRLALSIDRAERPATRRVLLVASLLSSLGVLAYFKYANFLGASAAWLTGAAFEPLDIFLPVGISFYTFQSLSYVVDVYRRELRPTRSLLDYAFFLSFFPQIVAGPIVRARELLPQIQARPEPDAGDTREALFLMLRGLAKKALLADYLGLYCDLVFEQPTAYSGPEVWLAMYGYAFQIYFDFSGYSDMAVGMARALGFRLPENFRTPYRATSLSEFWRRWHITLSEWLRDYLYISLGGNRRGRARQAVNLLVTMLLGGLWHGAAWRFVLWGGAHGLGLALHKQASKHTFPKALGWVLTFHSVVVLWVFFRAQSFGDAFLILRQATQQLSLEVFSSVLQARHETALVVGLAACVALAPPSWGAQLRRVFSRAPLIARAAVMLCIVQGVLQLQQTTVRPFIYFQF